MLLIMYFQKEKEKLVLKKNYKILILIIIEKEHKVYSLIKFHWLILLQE